MTSPSPYGPLRSLFITLCIILIGASIVRYWKSMPTSLSTHTAMQPVITSSAPIVAVPVQQTVNPSVSRPEEPAPSPAPEYTITPTPPTSGGDGDYTMQLDECHRAGDKILCAGTVTNNTDAPMHTYLRDSSAVDDKGNSFFIGSFLGVGIGFPGFGPDDRIMPNVPTKFALAVDDAHRDVKAINLQINIDWTGDAKYAALIFPTFPVQSSEVSAETIHPNAPEHKIEINSIAPVSGAINDFSLLVQECHRSGDVIACYAQATNHTDARAVFTGCCGTSVDDKGNSSQVSFEFNQSLIPGVATNVPFTIYDNHQSVKSVNIQLHCGWEPDHIIYLVLVYKDVPVQ